MTDKEITLIAVLLFTIIVAICVLGWLAWLGVTS